MLKLESSTINGKNIVQAEEKMDLAEDIEENADIEIKKLKKRICR